MNISQLKLTEPISLFISYNIGDQGFVNVLKSQLYPLLLHGIVSKLRDSSDVPLGYETEQKVSEYIKNASIILLLVSAEFLADQSCQRQVELAMQRNEVEKDKVHVVPLLIRPALWQQAPFAKLQILPRDHEPIMQPTNVGALNEVAEEIKKLVEENVLSPSPPEEKPITAEEFFGEGQRLFKREDYEAALRAFERAREINPQFVPAYISQGLVLCELERPNDALVAYDQAGRLDPQRIDVYVLQGLAYYKLREYAKALEAYEKAINHKYDLAVVYDHKACALCQLKRYNDALDSCEQAIALDPHLASAYDNQGWALYKLERYKDALDSCEQALKLDPHLATAYNHQGRIFYQTRRNREALNAYEQAIREYQAPARKKTNHLYRKLANVYNNKGLAHTNLSGHAVALYAYENAIRLYEQAGEVSDSKIAGAYKNKGIALIALNRFVEALDTCSRAIRIYLTYKEILLSNPSQREDILQINRNLALVYANKGYACYQLRQYDSALSNCDRAIQYDRKLAAAGYTKADALEKLGRQEEADNLRKKLNR